MKYKVLRDNEVELWNINLSGNRVRHREVGPAVTWTEEGSKYWYKEGECHRDGELPSVIWADGTKWWYRDGVKYKSEKAH